MDLVRYEGSQEWSALYVDGKLDTVGDHYVVEERISELAGVDVRQSDDFMQGGEQREDVAQTVSEAETYGAKVADAEIEADRLMREAEALVAETKKLRGNK